MSKKTPPSATQPSTSSEKKKKDEECQIIPRDIVQCKELAMRVKSRIKKRKISIENLFAELNSLDSHENLNNIEILKRFISMDFSNNQLTAQVARIVSKWLDVTDNLKNSEHHFVFEVSSTASDLEEINQNSR
jgi:hypothetical protein